MLVFVGTSFDGYRTAIGSPALEASGINTNFQTTFGAGGVENPSWLSRQVSREGAKNEEAVLRAGIVGFEDADVAHQVSV